MRPIDADAIPYTMLYKENWLEGTGCEKQGVWKSDIDAMPTIEERKTGAWIREDKHYKDSEQEYYYYEEHCSVCGARRKIGWAEANYCPNCGADMRGE